MFSLSRYNFCAGQFIRQPMFVRQSQLVTCLLSVLLWFVIVDSISCSNPSHFELSALFLSWLVLATHFSVWYLYTLQLVYKKQGRHCSVRKVSTLTRFLSESVTAACALPENKSETTVYCIFGPIVSHRSGYRHLFSLTFYPCLKIREDA